MSWSKLCTAAQCQARPETDQEKWAAFGEVGSDFSIRIDQSFLPIAWPRTKHKHPNLPKWNGMHLRVSLLGTQNSRFCHSQKIESVLEDLFDIGTDTVC